MYTAKKAKNKVDFELYEKERKEIEQAVSEAIKNLKCSIKVPKILSSRTVQWLNSLGYCIDVGDDDCLITWY